MTNEEAIEVLAQDLPCETDEDLSEAMTMAIKALEQQPCDDCISRQAVLDAINTYDKFGYTETGCFVREPKCDYVPYIHYDDVIKCIKNASPVTPKEKSEYEHDHDVVKAYNDGQAFILDKIRAEIENKMNSGQWSETVIYGMKKTIAVIDKYRGE